MTVPDPFCSLLTASNAVARIASRSYVHAVQSSAGTSSRDAQVITPSKTREEWQQQDAVLVRHLNDVFSPLNFPPELASRILTHASHPDAMRRHNGRLAFVGAFRPPFPCLLQETYSKDFLGRRVLQSYLLMFIHSSPALRPEHNYDTILERALNTYVLGEHVAPKWALGKVLKWRPMNVGHFSKPLGPSVDVPSPLMNLERDNARGVGMYKVHGTTVEAIVGGIFHQFVSTVHLALSGLLLMSIRVIGRLRRTPSLPHPHTPEPPTPSQSRRSAYRVPRPRSGDLREDGRTAGALSAIEGWCWALGLTSYSNSTRNNTAHPMLCRSELVLSRPI